MAVSNVAIANGALSRLGEPRIESLTQSGNSNARTMNAAFERCRDQLLRKYPWSFALKRASIAADSDQSTWGEWNRYSLPADYIRLLRDDESGQQVDWRIEGQYVLSYDASPLQFRYIARIEDPNYFDACFVELFEIALAMAVCKEVTGSNSHKESLRQDYKEAMAEAKQMGAFEKEASEFPEDSWIAARR